MKNNWTHVNKPLSLYMPILTNQQVFRQERAVTFVLVLLGDPTRTKHGVSHGIHVSGLSTFKGRLK